MRAASRFWREERRVGVWRRAVRARGAVAGGRHWAGRSHSRFGLLLCARNGAGRKRGYRARQRGAHLLTPISRCCLAVPAPTAKTRRRALARRLLAMQAPSPQAREDAEAFMRRVAALEIVCCPHCRIGRWRVLQELGRRPGGPRRHHRHFMPRAAVIRTGKLTQLARSRRRRAPGWSRAHSAWAPRRVLQRRLEPSSTRPRRSHAAPARLAKLENGRVALARARR